MNLYFYFETISILSFILFSLTCFIRFQSNTDIEKIIYLFNLFFIVCINGFHYFFVLSYGNNKLTIISSLLILMICLIFLILSVLSNQFIRLRVLFIPFFLILILFRFFSTFSPQNNNYNTELFDNNFLVLHILASLLSYSLLTISLVSSFCIFIQDLFLKKMKYNKLINDFLPSIYESELLTIRFLYITVILLIISLISGLFYYIETGSSIANFLNEKVFFSLLSLLVILLLIFIRAYRGLSGQIIFKMILLCYLFISFSYFGIKLLGQ